MRSLMVLVLLSITLLVGCGVPQSKTNDLSIGMTKEQVIEVLGKPTTVSATGGIEYLNYELRTPGALEASVDYFVRLVDGTAEAYGNVGDFDSTKTPETKSTIDLNIQEQ